MNYPVVVDVVKEEKAPGGESGARALLCAALELCPEASAPLTGAAPTLPGRRPGSGGAGQLPPAGGPGGQVCRLQSQASVQGQEARRSSLKNKTPGSQPLGPGFCGLVPQLREAPGAQARPADLAFPTEGGRSRALLTRRRREVLHAVHSSDD